ncbi:hypothetical protein AVEN_247891-1 [Araneus ventricosus]|uniref:Uncharacterized protein n=1 Tax=Araneus ventricosus TaxID=182803 RepID=A0A4Y2HTA3_ARAVE|nr:hypothetical protein AVEN_247891-1 [Araneus ventricosus]
MTSMTPELAPPLQTSSPWQWKDFWSPKSNFNRHQAHIHSGSSVESGIEPDTLRPRCPGLATSQQVPSGVKRACSLFIILDLSTLLLMKKSRGVRSGDLGAMATEDHDPDQRPIQRCSSSVLRKSRTIVLQ